MSIVRMSFAEFVGTFALTFVGGGAIIVTGGSDLVAIALAHGLILGVMISALIHISGGQFNPAITIALAAIRKQPAGQAGAFIVAQVTGSIVAAGLLRLLLVPEYDVMAVNLGATLGEFTQGDDPRPIAAGILEAIAAFFLMFVIMGVAVDARRAKLAYGMAGLAIGLTITADILFFGKVTGASMNPARSIGPALVGGVWDFHWVYWIGPIVGALAAATSYEFIFGSDVADE